MKSVYFTGKNKNNPKIQKKVEKVSQKNRNKAALFLKQIEEKRHKKREKKKKKKQRAKIKKDPIALEEKRKKLRVLL